MSKRNNKETYDKLKRADLAKKACKMHDKLLDLYMRISKTPEEEKRTYTHMDVEILLGDITFDYMQISDLIREIFLQEIYDRTGRRPPE